MDSLKAIKILKSKEVDIDNVNDGVSFTMKIFSEGNYDKSLLRNVVRNVGIQLQIKNYHNSPLVIKNDF